MSDSAESEYGAYRCFGCGFEFDSLDEMRLIPGADGRDGRHHCDQCYVDWLAEVTR